MERLLSNFVLLTVLFFSAAAVAAPEVEQANQLIGEGRYVEAFELLEPLEFDLSGDETFDLLFGFAALEAGHVSLSTLALERVLAVNPNNNTARFHLARAYYVLSDFDGARREFEMLLSMNPTAGIRETVGQYLDAIAAREPGAATVTTGFVSLGLGSDSNVTGGTSRNSVFLPAIPLDYSIPETDDEEEDSYSNLATGVDLIHNFDEARSVYAGADLNNKAHSDRDDLDYLLLGAKTGYQHAFGNQVARAGLNLGYMRFDDDPYQENTTLEFEWRNTFAQRSQVGVVLTGSEYRHRDSDDEVSDYDNLDLSLSFLRVLGEQGEKLVSFSLDFGEEEAINDRDDGDADYVELGVVGQMQFSDTRSGFLLISFSETDYDGENALFAKKRSDSQTSLVGGLVFELKNSISVRATVVLSETSSNLELYDSSREDFSISLRKDFL